jgi:hypothetical protein
MISWRVLEPGAPVSEEVMAALYDRTLLGVTLRGWFDPEPLSAAVTAARQGLAEVSLGEPGLTGGGVMLAPTAHAPLGPSLDAYFAAAHALDSLFSVRARVAEALRAEVPGYRDGRSYAWATLRFVAPGAEVPVHCDTYAPSPSFEHLHEITDRRTQLSWYVVVQAPSTGGALELVCPREAGAPARDAAGVAVPLAAGDLVLFDAGRHYHRIGRVFGEQARCTVGGFAARRSDGKGVFFWG